MRALFTRPVQGISNDLSIREDHIDPQSVALQTELDDERIRHSTQSLTTKPMCTPAKSPIEAEQHAEDLPQKRRYETDNGESEAERKIAKQWDHRKDLLPCRIVIRSEDAALVDSAAARLIEFLPLVDVGKFLQVSRAWRTAILNKDGKILEPHWSALERGTLPEAIKKHLPPSRYDRIRAHFHGFRPEVSVKSSTSVLDLEIQRGFQVGTFGHRGKIGVVTGRHVYKILWTIPYGTCETLGVGLASTTLESRTYQPLIGDGIHSWGVVLSQKSMLGRCGSGLGSTDGPRVQGVRAVIVGDGANSRSHDEQYHIHYLILDRNRRSLEIIVQGGNQVKIPLPREVDHLPLYPMIARVYRNARAALLYLGDIDCPRLADENVSPAPDLN